LHICVFHDDSQISLEIGEKLCGKWRDILSDLSEETGIDLLFSKGFNRTCELSDMQLDNQAMRLSCGAYFSKYASKTSNRNSKDINSINARKYPPSTFWGRDRELARMCELESYSFSYEGIDDADSESLNREAFEIISQYTSVLSHSFGFKKEIELSAKHGGGSLTICEGYTEVFYFSPKDYEQIREALKSHFDIYRRSSTLEKRRKYFL
jgi:hypothetical protein